MTMKRKSDDNESAASKRPKHERVRNNRGNNDARVTDLLKICLQKVCELQADLARESEEEEDAETAGYAACAIETLRFLAAEGLSPDHPVVKGLSQRLLSQGNER